MSNSNLEPQEPDVSHPRQQVVSECLEATLNYLSKGYSVIPIDGSTKKPLISWQEYQNKPATEEEVRKWFIKWPWAGAAIITGKISNIVVFDVDPRNNGDSEPLKKYHTVESKTGGGGNHFIFKYPDFDVPTIPSIITGVDLKSNGGYIIVPPSMHPSGNRYEWIKHLFNNPLPLPQDLINLITNHQRYTPAFNAEILNGVEEGNRNESATSVIGLLLSRIPEYKWEEICWPLLEGWNDRNNPPLKPRELRSVFDSIASREKSKNSEDSIYIPNAFEFLNTEFGNIEWIVNDLIPVGGKAIIVAKRESYKTWLALYISYCITHGSSLWDNIETCKSKVLYIANDDPQKNFQNRVKNFSFDENFFIYHNALPRFNVEGKNFSFNAVKKLIQQKGIDLVIIDVLRNTHDRDSNSDKEAKIVLEKYNELREVNKNLTFIFNIHPSKENQFEKSFRKRQAEEAVGSYYWEAAVDTVISLIKATDDEQVDTVQIAITKNKQSDKKIKPFIGIRRKPNCPIDFVFEEYVPDKLKEKLAEEAIFQYLEENGETEREALINFLKTEKVCSGRIAEKVLPRLVKDSIIGRTSTKPYSYFIPQTANNNKDYENAESSMNPEQKEFWNAK